MKCLRAIMLSVDLKRNTGLAWIMREIWDYVIAFWTFSSQYSHKLEKKYKCSCVFNSQIIFLTENELAQRKKMFLYPQRNSYCLRVFSFQVTSTNLTGAACVRACQHHSLCPKVWNKYRWDVRANSFPVSKGNTENTGWVAVSWRVNAEYGTEEEEKAGGWLRPWRERDGSCKPSQEKHRKKAFEIIVTQ